MNGEVSTGGESATLVDPTPAVVDYNAPPNFRSGDVPDSDGGDAPEDKGDEKVEDKTAATDEATKKASEAGKELQARKGSLLGDLNEERDRRKAAETALAEERRILDSWKPILAKLDGRPDLQHAVMNGEITIAKAEATKDREDRAELEEIAADMGYVKADGTTPDLERAERYRARHLKWAKQTAEPMVQPLARTAEQQAALKRVDEAVAYATRVGDADPEIVRAELTAAAAKNPQWLLDNDSGNLLYDRCVAKTVRAGKTKAAPPARREAADKTFVDTEASGGRHAGPKLTATEKALGEQYGLSDKDWERAEAHTGKNRGYTRLTDD